MLVSSVQQSGSVIHIYILSQGIIKYWVEFPVLYRRSLLVIYFIYSSVAMLRPASSCIPPTHLSPLVTVSLFSVCESLSVWHTSSFVSRVFCCWWLFSVWAEFSDCGRANVWLLLEQIPEERAGPARKVSFYYWAVSEDLAAQVTLTTRLCGSGT